MINPLSSLMGMGISAGFGALASWASSGSVWILHELGKFMSYTTSPEVTSSWFGGDYSTMVYLAVMVVLPMFCIGAIHAVIRQSPALLLRGFLVHLPLAILMMFVAVQLVHLGLSVTDALSNALLKSSGSTTKHLLNSAITVFSVGSAFQAPSFVVFIFAIVVTICGFILWMELVVRAAAITVATLFFPLVLAAFTWPALSRWCRRLAETVAALILSKLVVVAILVLGVSAVGSSVGGGSSYAAGITGIALLILAVFAPFSLFKLIPAIEGSAANYLEGARGRITHTAAAPIRAGKFVAGLAVTGGGSAGAGAGAGTVALAGAQGSSQSPMDKVPFISSGGGMGAGSAGIGGVGGGSGGTGSGGTGEGIGGLIPVFEEAEERGIPAGMVKDTIMNLRSQGTPEGDIPAIALSRVREHDRISSGVSSGAPSGVLSGVPSGVPDGGVVHE
ncbi:MAG: hypothetical protein M1456_06380 [Actinobacteria bacterium]|nr:hypothetical protein [Actinomycetota bacterium]